MKYLHTNIDAYNFFQNKEQRKHKKKTIRV